MNNEIQKFPTAHCLVSDGSNIGGYHEVITQHSTYKNDFRTKKVGLNSSDQTRPTGSDEVQL
jgi:hypothetical protein